MSVTVRDISRNADAFRRAFPHWPSPEPDSRVRLMHPDEPLADPVGAGLEPGDLYGPEEG